MQELTIFVSESVYKRICGILSLLVCTAFFITLLLLVKYPIPNDIYSYKNEKIGYTVEEHVHKSALD